MPSIEAQPVQEEDEDTEDAFIFSRDGSSRCEDYGALAHSKDGTHSSDLLPAFCRCPEGLFCRHRDTGKCMQCTGTFLAWRQQMGMAADVTILGLRLAPRCLFLTLLFNSHQPHIQKLYPISTDGKELDLDLDPLQPDVRWMILPHVYFAGTLARLASDSFWWIMALACGVMSQFRRELELINQPRRASIQFLVDTLADVIKDVTVAICAICFVLVAHNVLGEAAEYIPWVIDWLLLADAIRAAMLPCFLIRKGHHCSAMVHLTLLVFLVSISEQAPFDCLILLLIGGPGAASVAVLLNEIDASCRSRTHSQVIVLDRTRLVKSSVHQLRRLPTKKLTQPPTVVFAIKGSSAEPGVDLGGLRRDWLGQFTKELFDPAAGLMDSTLLGGTPFAKLRPGGDLQCLEALGKALGLALRERQPLGIDLCAPQALMMVHLRLPLALDRIEKSVRAGLEELKKLGFSQDWLKWVSLEEYKFWKSVVIDPTSFYEIAIQQLHPDGDAPCDINVAVAAVEHMRKKSLRTLVLDVKEELKALWRGLHSIPNLKLPSLADETRLTKRKLDETCTGESYREAVERSPKRARTDRTTSSDRNTGLIQGHSALPNGFSVLQGMLSGMQDIPTAHWKSMTVHAPQRRVSSEKGAKTISWFWTYVESLPPQGRAELLQWITGYRRMPINGFPPPSTKMVLYLTNESDKHFPCAHTCTLQIDLPQNYETETILHERLSIAAACREFHMA